MVGAEDGTALKVSRLERASHTEFYLVGSVEEAAPNTEEVVGAQYAEVAAILAADGIQPIQEKVYGLAGERDTIARIRADAFRKEGLDPAMPFTFLEGRPIDDSRYAGLQIWGVAPADGNKDLVTTVHHGGRVVGRSWTCDGFRALHLSGVRGTLPGGGLPSDVTHQAQQMFANAGAMLEAEGYNFLQVARTWIYLARLLDWYGEFNRVRTGYYTSQGMTGTPLDTVFPASTGIQGRTADEECVMDVFALAPADGGDVRVEPILGSWRQPPAFSYGSSFSRGMTIEIEDRKTVLISGTASINTAGETTRVGDAEGQCLETLQDIAAILEEQGGGLDSIASATVFCKTREVYDAFHNVTRLLQVPFASRVPVIADVCRSDLLIEIEAVALI